MNVAAVLSTARDAKAATPPWTPTVEALAAEVRTALPDDPAITEPLITAVRAIKDAQPDLDVKVAAYRHFLFIQFPRTTEGRRHE